MSEWLDRLIVLPAQYRRVGSVLPLVAGAVVAATLLGSLPTPGADHQNESTLPSLVLPVFMAGIAVTAVQLLTEASAVLVSVTARSQFPERVLWAAASALIAVVGCALCGVGKDSYSVTGIAAVGFLYWGLASSAASLGNWAAGLGLPLSFALLSQLPVATPFRLAFLAAHVPPVVGTGVALAFLGLAGRSQRRDVRRRRKHR